jgi:hypothetical protein
MKTALISLEETEMTTLEMIAEEGRKAGASENDVQSLKMFIPARPRPLLVARYASPSPDAGTACGDQRPVDVTESETARLTFGGRRSLWNVISRRWRPNVFGD